MGRVGRASGGDADLGWAVFSGAVSQAGLRGSREERKLSGYDSRRPRRAEGRGGLGGTQPPALEAATRGPKIARASAPDITVPQHGICGMMGHGREESVVGETVQIYQWRRQHHRVLRPPSQASRNIRSSRPLSLASTSYSSLFVLITPPPLARPTAATASPPSNVQPTNFLSVCPPVCAPVG